MRTKLLALGMLALSAPVLGTVYYVSPGGSDGNNGLTTGAAFEHVQRAGDLMTAGDTVFVRAGTYYEPTPGEGWAGIHAVRSGSSGSPITFRNYPGETPVVDNNYESTGFGTGGDWIVVDGFKVIHGEMNNAGCIKTGDDWVVRNCHLSNARAPVSGQHANAIRIQRCSRTLIYNCKIEDCHITAGDNHNATGIMLYNHFNITVQNCDISDAANAIFDKDSGQTNRYFRNYLHHTTRNGFLGPNQYDDEWVPRHWSIHENICYSVGGSGISSQIESTNCDVYNNTLYRAGGFGQGPRTENWSYWNNIVIDSHSTGGVDGRRGYFFASVGCIPRYSDYNCVYPVFQTVLNVYNGDDTYNLDQWRSAFGHDTHTFVADPQFVNTAALDLHLAGGSPCIGAGIRHYTAETVDRDVGAYPYGDTTVVGLLPSGAPTIAIADPQGSGTYVTTNSSIDLAGTASDDLSVVSVIWDCDTDGSGTATGTDSWSVAGVPLAEGPNVITVTAQDEDANTASAVLTVDYRPLSANQAPVADAGSDQSVTAGGSVILDGRASYDPDEWPSALTYAWTQVSGPSVTLFNASSDQPSFIAASEGEYLFQLTVYDGADYGTDQVTVNASAPGENLAPIADAGDDVVGAVGIVVELDGSASSDPDSGPSALTYAWVQDSGPTVGLGGASTANANFLPSAEGTCVFTLTVSDGEDQSWDSVTVDVLPPGSNLPPTADAGADQAIAVDANVRLDGSASSDPESDPLTYAWTQISGPIVTIHGADGATAFVTLTEADTYIFLLTVADAQNSDDDTVTITVEEEVASGNTNTTDTSDPTTMEELEVRPNLLVAGDLESARIVAPERLDGVAVSIYAVSGELVTGLTLTAGSGCAEVYLADVATMEGGVYIAIVEATGTRFQARFVVQP